MKLTFYYSFKFKLYETFFGIPISLYWYRKRLGTASQDYRYGKKITQEKRLSALMSPSKEVQVVLSQTLTVILALMPQQMPLL